MATFGHPSKDVRAINHHKSQDNQLVDRELDIETKVHQLITQSAASDNPPLFFLLNSHEINILEENKITVKEISYHYYEQDKNICCSEVVGKYEDMKYPGDIYLLGKGPIVSHNIEDISSRAPNLHIELDFNILKYLSMFPEEIIASTTTTSGKFRGKTEEEISEINRVFVNTLKSEFLTSLFYCSYNTGILGVEGYERFEKEFYPYLATVDNIYLVNEEKELTWRSSIDDFNVWVRKSEYKDKVKYIDVHVGKLFQTNPELIAHHRTLLDKKKRDNRLDNIYNFSTDSEFTRIDQNIYIGSDRYRRIREYKELAVNRKDRPHLPSDEDISSWFSDDDVTHILNVNDEEIKPNQLPSNTVVYGHYPIDEREKDASKSSATLHRAADRLHELISQDKNHLVYVHCAMGINRSPAAVIMYLMKYKGMSFFEAYTSISTKRRILTAVELFDILYKEALSMSSEGGKVVSPLKLRTHAVSWNGDPNAYMFALYDTLRLLELYKQEGEVEVPTERADGSEVEVEKKRKIDRCT